MRDPELELEAELEQLVASLSESELEKEIEGEAQGQPQRQELTCRPPIVLNGFRSGEYALRPSHYARLLAEPFGSPIIVIRGHSDNQGNAITNAGISLSRAFEVKDWLTNRNGGTPIAGRVIIEDIGAGSPIASAPRNWCSSCTTCWPCWSGISHRNCWHTRSARAIMRFQRF